jgi:hypothetical protein
MGGNSKKAGNDTTIPEDEKTKLPSRPPEADDEEDGDIATPKRDRDDEDQGL